MGKTFHSDLIQWERRRSMFRSRIVIKFQFFVLSFTCFFAVACSDPQAPASSASSKSSATPVAADTRYRSELGKFAVAFPAKPKQRATRKSIGDIELAVVMEFSSSSADGGEVYFVSYVDYPEIVLATRDRYQLLMQAIEGIVRSDNLKLLGKHQTPNENSDETYDMYAEGVVDGQNVHYANRLVLQENRLYQVSAVYAIEQTVEGRPSSSAQDFLDSFQLLEQMKATIVEPKPKRTE